MYIPKQYGKSKIDNCPFCEEQAITMNKQKIPVCIQHSESKLGDMKCVCGEYLELKTGRYGIYFNCLRCGNINKKKIFEINRIVDINKTFKYL